MPICNQRRDAFAELSLQFPGRAVELACPRDKGIVGFKQALRRTVRELNPAAIVCYHYGMVKVVPQRTECVELLLDRSQMSETEPNLGEIGLEVTQYAKFALAEIRCVVRLDEAAVRHAAGLDLQRDACGILHTQGFEQAMIDFGLGEVSNRQNVGRPQNCGLVLVRVGSLDQMATGAADPAVFGNNGIVR